MARHIREISVRPEEPAVANDPLSGPVFSFIAAVFDAYFQLFLRVKGIIPS